MDDSTSVDIPLPDVVSVNLLFRTIGLLFGTREGGDGDAELAETGEGLRLGDGIGEIRGGRETGDARKVR